MAANLSHEVPRDLSRQRVLFVFLGSELGGAERQGLLLARFLKQNCDADVEVWGLAADGPGRLAGICAEFGLRWRAVPFSLGGKPLGTLMELLRLARQLRGACPTAILGYTWLPNVACGLLWRFTGARVYVWNQRDEGLDLNRGFLHRTSVHLTKCFVANSTKGLDFLINTYKIDVARCSVIHNGIAQPLHESSRDAHRDSFGIPANAMVACMVANLHSNKDHATLLRAWRIVLDRVPASTPPLKLILAGRFDGLTQSLQELTVNLGLNNHVRFCGELRNVNPLLCAADLYVHSSVSEGLPNGVLEAMAAGLPVVGTLISGITEALGEEMHDCLAPPGDAEALADKIICMIGNAPRRSACGAANKQRIGVKFNLEKMGAAYTALLRDHLEPEM